MTLAPAGCVRQAAKEATKGALSAVEEKVDEDRKPQGGGQRPEGRPQRGADGDDSVVEPVARGAVEGSISALRGELVPLREVTRETAAAAADGVISGAIGQQDGIADLVSDASAAAGQAFARAMAQELRAQLEPADLQRASRAVAMGLAEGVERKIQPWHLLIAFAIGVVLTAGIAGIIAAVARRRHERAAPPPTVVPPPHAPIRQVRHAPPRLRPHAPGATP